MNSQVQNSFNPMFVISNKSRRNLRNNSLKRLENWGIFSYKSINDKENLPPKSLNSSKINHNGK